MNEIKKNKKMNGFERPDNEVLTMEEPQEEMQEEMQETTQEKTQEYIKEVHRARKSHKPKEEKYRPGISDKLHKVTHRTLSTTERLIKSLSSAYEHIFIGDGSTNANFEKDQGLKFFSKSHYKKALEHFEAYVENGDENDADVLYMIATCYVKEDQQKKAVEFFYRADELKPHDQDIITAFAKCLLTLERYDEALSYLKKAIGLNQDDADLYYYCANCYEKNDQVEEAKRMYKKAIDLNPRQAVYYHALGFLYENLGDHKDAIVCFKKAMDVERDRSDGEDGGGGVVPTQK